MTVRAPLTASRNGTAEPRRGRTYLSSGWSVLLLWLAAFLPIQAQAFPDRPIRFVVGYPPGQTVDVTARAYAAAMSRILGQSVFVDNKAGANGIIGAQTVARAEPDGYTLLFGTSGQLAINPAIYKELPYQPLTGMTSIGRGALGRLYLVVPSASPYKTVDDLIAYAKAHPGKLSYGSGGVGITANLAMEMLKRESGVDIVHVPYKGSPAALNDLLGERIDVMFDAGALLLPQIESGKLRVLAVSSRQRYSRLPDVPTLSEAGLPGFEVASWTALLGPASMPADVVRKLNAAMNEAAKAPDVLQTVRAAGSEPASDTPAEMHQFLQSEVERWGRAAKDAGVPLQ
jgi:tripartite-type tricarboxylate transporter receptor subunit TctC